MSSVTLLDTPKRIRLSSRSSDLRIQLKEWEKTFASSHGGQKPGKDDIKSNGTIARKYKEYNRFRDVLAGRVRLDALHEAKSPEKRTKSTTLASGNSSTPRKTFTRTSLDPNHIASLDPYDAPFSASPRPLLHEIGPTPERDGKVLGLFDMLSGSKRSLQATPSARKRKRDALIEDENIGKTPAKTPGRSAKVLGDILHHLGTSSADRDSGQKKHSRTPASDGKKFMLSQLFATPTAMRYASLIEDLADRDAATATPLRDAVLGLTPSHEQREPQAAADATPAYLKRTASFKQRLLSATATDVEIKSATDKKGGQQKSKFLRRTRSMPKPLSQIVQDLRQMEEHEHDDDLDALREIEGNGPDVQSRGIHSEETEIRAMNDDAISVEEFGAHEVQKENFAEPRVWKKKGQKRTTRRSIMRPTTVKSRDAPQFIAAEEEGSDGEQAREDTDDILRPLNSTTSSGNRAQSRLPDGPSDTGDADFDEELSSAASDKDKKKSKTAKSKSKRPDITSTSTKSKDVQPGKKTPGTINPNAHTHMNFRSLKIRNKNSKAKGGGRFGRGRR